MRAAEPKVKMPCAPGCGIRKADSGEGCCVEKARERRAPHEGRCNLGRMTDPRQYAEFLAQCTSRAMSVRNFPRETFFALRWGCVRLRGGLPRFIPEPFDLT